MKEKFERFKNEKIVINVRSQKQYDDLMKMCEEQGLKWSARTLATEQYFYDDYKEETCIDLDNLSRLYYGDINYYKSNGYKIITYKDFMKKSNQFKKSDLKPHHILKLLNGDYVVMKFLCDVDDITNSLEHKVYKDWQINEVWEFETLVWKRKEILDEVEKNWLNNFIRSTDIDVISISKIRDIENEYLCIKYLKLGEEANLNLPKFHKDTMYKGMEADKTYTLVELGLED